MELSFERIEMMAAKPHRSNKERMSNTERIEELAQIVIGNGQAGLKGRLLIVETKLDGMKEDISEIKGSVTWAQRLLITETIGIALTVGILWINLATGGQG